MSPRIDGKSFVIGFLLALVIMLLLGAGSSAGTMDVRIVGISGHDRLPVIIENSRLEIELTKVGYGVEIPVVIKGK